VYYILFLLFFLKVTIYVFVGNIFKIVILYYLYQFELIYY